MPDTPKRLRLLLGASSLLLHLAWSAAALAAPCAVLPGDHYDVDGAGRHVLRRVTLLQPEGCTWYAPRGIVLNGYQLSNSGLAPVTIRTDPGVSAILVTDERSGNYRIDNLRIEAPGGRGIEFVLSEPNGAAGSQISRVSFVGASTGIWGLGSQVRVTQCEFDSPIGVLVPGGAQGHRVYHPTIDGNVFRNAVWAVFVVGTWERSHRRDGWPAPQTATELTVRGNTIDCIASSPWSAGVITVRVNEAGIEENTIRGCTYGVLMDTSHRVLVHQNTIDDLGAGRALPYTTRGVLDRYSAGWAVYHNDIHAMWGVQSVQAGGLYLMQDAVWWNRITAMQGYRLHVDATMAYPETDASSHPDKEWAGNNHYPYTGQPTPEAGDDFFPLVVTGGADAPYPGFPYPYAHDPDLANVTCDDRRWTWVYPGAANGAPDDVKGNFAAGYVAARDVDGDGIHDEPVPFPGHATHACTIAPGWTRLRAGPFWWDRCFRVQEFAGAGRGRVSPGADVTPCQ
jgi:hypothetical protein